jgi:hypothetical protein
MLSVFLVLLVGVIITIIIIITLTHIIQMPHEFTETSVTHRWTRGTLKAGWPLHPYNQNTPTLTYLSFQY